MNKDFRNLVESVVNGQQLDEGMFGNIMNKVKGIMTKHNVTPTAHNDVPKVHQTEEQHSANIAKLHTTSGSHEAPHIGYHEARNMTPHDVVNVLHNSKRDLTHHEVENIANNHSHPDVLRALSKRSGMLPHVANHIADKINHSSMNTTEKKSLTANLHTVAHSGHILNNSSLSTHDLHRVISTHSENKSSGYNHPHDRQKVLLSAYSHPNADAGVKQAAANAMGRHFNTA